jgi:hypothetical protein
MNRYKIDWNRYSTESYPYALFSKRRWFARWEHVASHRTKEDARAHYEKLIGLPIYLPADGA